MKMSRSAPNVWILSASLLVAVTAEAAESGAAAVKETGAMAQTGRPVRILSLSFYGKSIDYITRLVDREAGAGTDLVVLPETWLGQKDNPEALDGPTITTFASLAK